MSRRRPATRPPELPGYTVDRLLGSGGFADVYLYTQHLPQRPVAIKVLTHEAAVHSTQDFVAEANVMAQLSGHSSIVTIYHAGTAADERPYIVMQYCPLPNLAERVTQRPLPVAEALGIGVRLAGAVETAHRAGIVHRDIKPANILTTEYGRPALTDFGIAGFIDAAADDTGGVSVPWASPEAVDGHGVGVRGDVYSLAATVHTLLAGRSPFNRPGGPNSRLDYITRIKREPVPGLGRDDVPASLERALTVAMSKAPEHRPATALDLARALQVVEQELRLPMTDIEVPDTSWLSTPRPAPDPGDAEAVDDGPTVVRAVSEVDAQPAPATDGAAARRAPGLRAGTSSKDAGDGAGPPHGGHVEAPGEGAGRSGTVVRPVRQVSPTGSDGAEDSATTGRLQRPTSAPQPAAAPPPAGRRGKRWLVLAGATAVVATAILAAGSLRGEPQDPPDAPAPPVDTITVPATVPAPTGVRGERLDDATVEFTWVEPTTLGEVNYSWSRATGAKEAPAELVTEPPLEVRAEDRVCIELKIVTEQGTVSAQPARVCVE